MDILLLLMLFSLLIPILQSFRSARIWERLLCYTSVSTRTALILLIISRFRDDPMIGLVAVVVLSLGNSGLMLLAHLIKGMEAECD
jgi:multicomponent Na+:H+ antiporter subunit F